MSRQALPVVVPEATRFSDDREQLNARWAPEYLNKHPKYAQTVEAGTTNLAPIWGRRRMAGSWAKAFIHFTASGQIDIEPWWKETTTDDWRVFGFAQRPGYNTVYDRFVELEKKGGIEAFQEAAQELMRLANEKSGGLVARDLFFDGCEAESHSRLIHDCQDDEDCPYAKQGKSRRRGKAIAAGGVTDDARKIRHRAGAKPADEAEELLIGEVDEDDLKIDEEKGIRVRVGKEGNKHWYRIADKEAGIRAYTGPRGVKRFWVGYLNDKAICLTFGAPVAIKVENASINEDKLYPELLEEVCQTFGRTPRSSGGDKLYSQDPIYQHNSERGIASIYPWRPVNQHEKRVDKPTHDRHGIPRCKHCSGETRFVRFAAQPRPRLWYRCTGPTKPGCDKVQTISCSTDWRALLPLWRNSEAYMSLRESAKEHERVHHLFRVRYKVGGDELANRPKRRGRDVQQLRANCALFIEWLRICWRMGYLDDPARFDCQPRARSNGSLPLARLRSRRGKLGLNRPYRQPAVRAGPDPPGVKPSDLPEDHPNYRPF